MKARIIQKRAVITVIFWIILILKMFQKAVPKQKVLLMLSDFNVRAWVFPHKLLLIWSSTNFTLFCKDRKDIYCYLRLEMERSVFGSIERELSERDNLGFELVTWSRLETAAVRNLRVSMKGNGVKHYVQHSVPERFLQPFRSAK